MLASKTAQDAKKASPRRFKKNEKKKKKKKNVKWKGCSKTAQGGGTPWARAEICGILEVLASILGGFLCGFEVLKTY